MIFKEFLKELKELKLPEEKYAVFGSGPLAVRGIRDSSDLDIIVKKDLWDKLCLKHSPQLEPVPCIKVGNIEVFKDWKPFVEDVCELIDTADIISGVRFVTLENVLAWKTVMGRDKDKRDVGLIKVFLKSN